MVSQTTRIYSNSAAVCVWLGPPDFFTSSALFKVHQISKSWLARSEALRNIGFKNTPELQNEYVEVAKMEFPEEDPVKLWNAVGEL
jgi:hypothetical protein